MTSNPYRAGDMDNLPRPAELADEPDDDPIGGNDLTAPQRFVAVLAGLALFSFIVLALGGVDRIAQALGWWGSW